MMFEIQVLTWDRHKNVAGLNQLMVISFSYDRNFLHNSYSYMIATKYINGGR